MASRSRQAREREHLVDLPVLVACGALATAMLWIFTQLGAFSNLELASEDLLLRLRDGFQAGAPAAPDRVTVVRITEADIQRFGHPVPDGVLADAIARILAAQPRAVGIDLFRDLPAGEGRSRLAGLARDHAEIVFIESLPAPGRAPVPAPEFVVRPSQRGFGDVLRDADGRVRRLLLWAWTEDGTPHEALPFQVAKAWLAREAESVAPTWIPAPEGSDPELRLGRGRLERLRSGDPAYGPFDDRGYQARANFRHGRLAYRTTTFGQLLDGSAEEALFRGRAVLVGSAAVSVGDVFFEPTADEGRAGVEIHALAVDQGLRTALDGEAPPRAIPPLSSWTGLFLLACLGATFGHRAHSRRRAVLFAGAALAVPAILAAGLLAAGWRGPVATASIAVAVAAALGGGERLWRERRDRLLIDRLLASQVSGDVRDVLWRERHRFLREGRLPARQATATILFADLVASAEVAEQTPPPLLLQWLEDCMAAFAEAVTANGGMLDDYWGDGLKASFGALMPRDGREDVERDACAAVDTALAMDSALGRLNAAWEPRGLGRARMRIGIHTGPVVVGSLGGLQRHKLTSVGDTVTVAARLEAYLREDPAAVSQPGGAGSVAFTRILVSEETVACLGGRFRSVFLGEETLRGRQAKVCIHRILGPATAPGSDTLSPPLEVSP